MHTPCSPLLARRRRLSSARLASADPSMNTNVFKLGQEAWILSCCSLWADPSLLTRKLEGMRLVWLDSHLVVSCCCTFVLRACVCWGCAWPGCLCGLPALLRRPVLLWPRRGWIAPCAAASWLARSVRVTARQPKIQRHPAPLSRLDCSCSTHAGAAGFDIGTNMRIAVW